MTFYCVSPDLTFCPPSYLVFFHGPTRQTVPPVMFTPVDSAPGPSGVHGTVHARWTLHDPGEYIVYAYPEFVFCNKWNKMEYPWFKAAVIGSPFVLPVEPGVSPAEGFGKCSSDEAEFGRYLSTSSPHLSTLFNDSERLFAWAPYKCKIPPRTIRQAVAEVPSINHLVFMGDSTSRSSFCASIWEKLHGTVANSLCDFKNHPSEYWEEKKGHKFTSALFDRGTRNVSFTFLWTPRNFTQSAVLFRGIPPPTHIIFNVGL
jgi:hypothetical protein